MDEETIKKYKEAGKIAKKAIDYSKEIIREGESYLEVTKKIEEKIKSLKGDFAFPINLSVNSIAAHYTAKINDDSVFKKGDLLKVDLGAHVDGFLSDTAYTMEIGTNENKDLTAASKEALKAAIDTIKPGVQISKIGAVIEDVIKSKGFTPIANLSGHQLEQWDLHAGLSIPNFDNKSDTVLEEGMAVAIEPFATNGIGHVVDAEKSEIYQLIAPKPVRSPTARKILEWSATNRLELPFCKRWVSDNVKSFGIDMSMRQLILNESIHNFPTLREEKDGLVSQHEHTILVLDSPIVTTA